METTNFRNTLDNATIVFDTSALCSVYNMTSKARHTLTEIFNFFANKIWLPAHVLEEFERNHHDTIRNPIDERYSNPKFLKDSYAKEVESFIAKVTTDEDFHPCFPEGAINKLKAEYTKAKDAIKEIKSIVSNELKRQRELINDEAKKDNDEFHELVTSFAHGDPYPFATLLEIAKEGDFRYRHSIPPGYMDNDKPALEKFGDLIIWKQIIEYAKEIDSGKREGQRKPIIYIVDDMKEDYWVLQSSGSHEKPKAVGPRPELIKEFRDATGTEIMFLTFEYFINKLKDSYSAASGEIPFFSGLEMVKDQLERISYQRELAHKLRDKIVIECDNCTNKIIIDASDIEWEWECANVYEREMGPEREYICYHTVECDDSDCGNEITVTFTAWEYPSGCINYTEIDVDGANLKKGIDIAQFLSLPDREPCHRCGESYELDDIGLCPTCHDELYDALNSDV